MPNLKVNFDPANMLLYDKGDPIEALGHLGIGCAKRSTLRTPWRPKTLGQWGNGSAARSWQANIPRFVKKLKEIGFTGPLCIEREVGNQQERLARHRARRSLPEGMPCLKFNASDRLFFALLVAAIIIGAAGAVSLLASVPIDRLQQWGHR